MCPENRRMIECANNLLTSIGAIIAANEETKKCLLNMNMIVCSFIPISVESNHFIWKKLARTSQQWMVLSIQTVVGFEWISLIALNVPQPCFDNKYLHFFVFSFSFSKRFATKTMFSFSLRWNYSLRFTHLFIDSWIKVRLRCACNKAL